MVLEIIKAAEEEGGAAIEEAYAEGYKAGLLDTAPERDYWKSIAERQRANAKTDLVQCFLIGAGAGIAVSTVAAIVIFIMAR